jgi:hypothetical protein
VRITVDSAACGAIEREHAGRRPIWRDLPSVKVSLEATARRLTPLPD